MSTIIERDQLSCKAEKRSGLSLFATLLIIAPPRAYNISAIQINENS